MKRLLLALFLSPVIAFAANEPLNISELAKDYCDATGQALHNAYSTNKSSSELTSNTITKLKSENVDLKLLQTTEAELRQNLMAAIDGVRKNKSKYASGVFSAHRHPVGQLPAGGAVRVQAVYPRMGGGCPD